VRQHAFGNASNDRAIEADTAMRTHDNQIHTLRLDLHQNLVGWHALSHHGIDSQTASC